jgi:inositol-hexakisphosphate kinase
VCGSESHPLHCIPVHANALAQVWNHATQSFVSKNKYRGREIRTADFPRVLRTFLDDGEKLLIDHIPHLLQKLHNLAAIVLALDGFRFYGCSVLLIYDGDRDVQEHFRRHSREAGLVPMAATQGSGNGNGIGIGGADSDGNSTTNGGPGQRDIGGSGRGHDGGTLLSGFTHSESDEYAEDRHRPDRTIPISPEKGRRSRSADVRSQSRAPAPADSHRAHLESHLRNQPHPHHHHDGVRQHQHTLGSNTRRIRGEINLRVVDFAHTITGRDFVPLPPGSEDPATLGRGYETRFDPETGLMMARFPPKYPDRPDMGFVFGLKNVADSLKEIWDEEMRTRKEENGTGAGAGEDGEARDLPEFENGDVWDRAFPNGVDKAEMST